MDQNIENSSNCQNVETKIQNEETPTTSNNQPNPCNQLEIHTIKIVLGDDNSINQVTSLTNTEVHGGTIGQISKYTSPRKCKRNQQDSSEAGPSHNHGNDSNPGTVESIDGNFWKCLDDRNHKILGRQNETKLTTEEFGDENLNLENLLKAHIGHLLPSELNTKNEDCFKLFSLAYESRDDSITRSVADALPQEIKISGRSPIQPSDVISFCHVLRSTERQITINVGEFSPVQFIGDGLKMFLKMVTETSHKIGELNISKNKLDEDSLVSMATCVHKIEELNLDKCEIGGRDIKVLTDAIARRETPIGWLFISGNKLDEDSLVSMATCVHKIEELGLGRCEIGGRKIKVLTDAIARRETPIGGLDISYNKLDEDSLVSMATCVHKIEKLFLFGCEIGGRKINVLTDAIARRETPMEYLDVRSNPLGDEGLKFLLQSFHKIDKLLCDDCDFTLAGEEELKRAEKLKKESRRKTTPGKESTSSKKYQIS